MSEQLVQRDIKFVDRASMRQFLSPLGPVILGALLLVPTVLTETSKDLSHDDWCRRIAYAKAPSEIAIARDALRQILILEPSGLPSLLFENEDSEDRAVKKPQAWWHDMIVPNLPRHRQSSRLALQVYRQLKNGAAPSIPFLIPGLSHPDPADRILAARAIAMIGFDAAYAAPEVVKLCQDRNQFVAQEAINALSAMGSGARSVLPQILELISETEVDEDVRTTAVHSLENVATEAPMFLPLLRQILSDPDSSLYGDALNVIESLGPAAISAIPECLELATNNPIDSVGSSALDAINAMGSSAKASYPVLLKLMTRSDYQHKEAVIAAISSIGPGSPQFQDSLFSIWEGIEDSSSPMSQSIRQALEQLGAPALPRLIDIIKSSASPHRRAAAETIQRMKRVGAPCAEALTEILSDPKQKTVHLPVALALSAVEPESTAYQPIFLEILQQPDIHSIIYVIGAIRDLRTPSEKLANALGILLRSENEFVRARTASAIADLDHSVSFQLVPQLTAALDDNVPNVRSNVIQALVNADKRNQDLVPRLINYLDDNDDDVRYAATTSLGKLGPIASEAVPELAKIALDLEEVQRRKAAYDRKQAPNRFGSFDFRRSLAENTRSAAITSLGAIAQRPDIAVPALRKALRDYHVSVQEFAAISLGQYRAHASEALPDLRKLMRGENDWRTSAAIIATTLIQPPSMKAVKTLIYLVENTRDNPRMQAIDALGLIGKMASPA
ncbi:HEAT repeat domain-containing protein, partial [Verrucomicrobia bacterium]|nr:HEAT repeat domain-containing protein [Verrucomicrobiota bacterium]